MEKTDVTTTATMAREIFTWLAPCLTKPAIPSPLAVGAEFDDQMSRVPACSWIEWMDTGRIQAVTWKLLTSLCGSKMRMF